jgi:glutaminase
VHAPRTGEPASPIQRYLEALHRRHATLAEGEVATYIPELAKADPAAFGICLATTDGHVYEVGDARALFTIQSISKPFAYGLALEDRGRRAVLRRVGVEPTGEAFNSIRLAPDTGRPLNPMVNAGAIATTGLVAGHSAEDRLHRLLATLSLYAGRPLELDDAVYRSERETGHRNRAIAHLLRNFAILGEDPDLPLDLYFKQCSIAVSCRDLSLMAATLANGGVNPLTRERAIREELVPSVLSVMTTCGMYDFAGEWVYEVGIPAKSGVAGGVLAVLPGQLGIGVWSPPLDERGNSRRGVAVCRDLSREFELHFLRVPRPSRATLRARYDLAAVRSKRQRPARDEAALARHGARARVYELQGDIAFAAVEAVIRQVLDDARATDVAVVDLRRVTRVAEGAGALVLGLVESLTDQGRRLVLANAQRHPRLLRFLEERLGPDEHWRLVSLPDLDAALEWAEAHLLADHTPGGADAAEALPLAEHPICRNLSAAQVETFEKLLEPVRFAAGERIVRKGEPADRLYFLASGEVSVVTEIASGELKRLSTLSRGMSFGELAVVSRTPRSADVRADEAVTGWALPVATFDRLGDEHPDVKLALLENLLANVCQTVARLTDEVATRAE